MKYDYNGVFISMQTIITLHFLRFAKSMSKWYTHVNAFYQYVLPVIDDKQGISNLLSKLSNVLSRRWWSSWYSFQKFIYQIIVFDSTLEKTCAVMSILEQKLRKIERENMFVHNIKRVTHLLCWELLIFSYSF